MPTDRTKIEAADLTVLTRVTDRGVFVDLLDRGCRFSRLYFEDTTIAQKVLASALEQLLAPPVAPLPVTPAPWFILEVEGRRFLAAKTTPDHPYHNRTRFMDVVGDEDYPRKQADLELICRLRNQVEP
jgi:hypothetical protein